MLKGGESERWQAESGSDWHAMRIVGVCRGFPKSLVFVNSIYTVFKLLLQIGDIIKYGGLFTQLLVKQISLY